MKKTANDEVRRQMGPTGKERTRIGTAAAAVLIVLAGCTDESATTPEPKPKKEFVAEVRTSGYSADIVEVKLQDGTRCAALLGYNKGGLSCDWQGEPK